MQILKGATAALVAVFLLPVSIYGQTSEKRPAPAPEATVVLNEQFFNSFLEAIFNNLKAPSAPLTITPGDRASGSSSGDCPSVIVLERQTGNVRTAVKLEQGKVLAPLVFSGSYSSTLLGCLEFSGWANSEWHLDFDPATQVLRARIKIMNMWLEGVPSLAQSSLTRMVQAALDQRINPLQILRVDQISGIVPIAPSGGSLRLRAREIAPDVLPGALYLRITYEFLPEG